MQPPPGPLTSVSVQPQANKRQHDGSTFVLWNQDESNRAHPPGLFDQPTRSLLNSILVRVELTSSGHCYSQWLQRVQDTNSSGVSCQHIRQPSISLRRFID